MALRRAMCFLAIVVTVSGCQAATDGAASATATGTGVSPPSAAPTSPPASAAGPSPSPLSSAPPTLLAVDSLVQHLVADLRVRRAPGLAGEPLGTLPQGAHSLVVDGPVAADGFAWYLLTATGLPMGSGCLSPPETDPYNCPVWWGWSAASAPEGSAWLAPADFDCPAWPDPYLTADFVYGMGRGTYLACYGGEERRIVGFYPMLPDDADLGGACPDIAGVPSWLSCNRGYQHLVIDEKDGYFGSAFILAIYPEVTMPARGQWVEVTGRFDHPAAQGCDFEGDDGSPPEVTITHCRAQFVVTAAQSVSR